MTNERKQAHLIIHGRVQGVFFRANTRDEARRLGLSGWVRNLADGTVEAVAQGAAERVEAWVRWCHEGPEMARVDDVEISWEALADDFDGFEIRR